MMFILSVSMVMFIANQEINAQDFGNVFARQGDIAVVLCNVNYPNNQTLEWYELEQIADPNPPPVYTNVNNPHNTTKNPDKYEMVLGPRYDLAIRVNRPENQHYCVVKDARGNVVSQPNTWNTWVTDGPTCQDRVIRASVNGRVRLVCRQGSHGSSYPMEWHSPDGTVLESKKEYHYETKHAYLTLTHEFVANASYYDTWFGCILYPKETRPNDVKTFKYATCLTRIVIV